MTLALPIPGALDELPHGLVLITPAADDPHLDTAHGPRVRPLVSAGLSTTGTGLACADLALAPWQAVRAHVHEHSDTIVRIVSGAARTVFGPHMTRWVDMAAPDDPTVPAPLLFIPAGIPHAAVNLGDAPVAAFEIRSIPDFTDDVVLQPHLQPHLDSHVTTLRGGL